MCLSPREGSSKGYKMEDENKFQKRQTAYWMDVSDLLDGSFVKGEKGTYYRTREGIEISRVNVFGIVLSKESSDLVEGITIEDGTGSINIRSFDSNPVFDGVAVEDVVNIIGKIREYNGVPFISAEIVRKKNREDLELRKKEKKLVSRFYEKKPQQTPEAEDIVIDNRAEKILELIKRLDQGEGVDVETVVKECKIENADPMIKELINNGDLFEVMPGKLKVLD